MDKLTKAILEGFQTGPNTMSDIWTMFKVNKYAFKYFGIICFDDLPGYFPQLRICHEIVSNKRSGQSND